MWRFFMALAAVGSDAAGVAGSAADPTLVQLGSGHVQGVADVANRTLMWRGIPYAQAPTGDRRWRSPLPAKSWAGVKEAKAFGPACAQLGPAWTSLAPPNSQAPCHNNMAGCVNWTWSNATSEDCLYANVYRSSVNASRPRPVVVYFAAGAFEWGSANDQENSGEGLGVKPGWQDVVFVTLNYRKGVSAAAPFASSFGASQMRLHRSSASSRPRTSSPATSARPPATSACRTRASGWSGSRRTSPRLAGTRRG